MTDGPGNRGLYFGTARQTRLFVSFSGTCLRGPFHFEERTAFGYRPLSNRPSPRKRGIVAIVIRGRNRSMFRCLSSRRGPCRCGCQGSA